MVNIRGVLRRIVARVRKPQRELTPREVVGSLGEPFTRVLCSMYEGEPQLGTDGKLYPLDTVTRISPRQGMWIYNLVRDTKPGNTLEIGLAFGFSTVYFLAALHSNGTGSSFVTGSLSRFLEWSWFDTRKDAQNSAGYIFVSARKFDSGPYPASQGATPFRCDFHRRQS